MKVLVTGGAGFIGSHIVDLLVKRGDTVVVVDDVSTGSLSNLNPAARYYSLGIGDKDLESVFAREKPEVVCHQAAHTVVTESVRDPMHDASVNILGSLNLFEVCLRFGCRRIVYASSSAVYGDPEYLPVDERHPVNPLAPYGVSKLTVERYLHAYQTIHKLEYVALRYANVYGPRQNPHGEAGVVALFARKMLSGERPTIYGSGDKTRAYVYVGDVARANLLALDSEAQGVFNIGTGVRTSDQAVFDILREELKYDDRPRYNLVRPGEIMHMSLDSHEARKNLGWEPRVTFVEGIRLAAAFYAARYVRVDAVRQA